MGLQQSQCSDPSAPIFCVLSAKEIPPQHPPVSMQHHLPRAQVLGSSAPGADVPVLSIGSDVGTQPPPEPLVLMWGSARVSSPRALRREG